MKNILLLLVVLSQVALADVYIAEYPKGPNGDLTPGELCNRASEYRYPEHIAYCERDVSSQQKDQIFESYRRIGYRLNPKNRSSYKIDHYIPLCAGGSNNDENLWPQHVSVYEITDPLEQMGCDKMKLGVLKQAKFIQLLKKVKNDLSQAKAVRDEISRLK